MIMGRSVLAIIMLLFLAGSHCQAWASPAACPVVAFPSYYPDADPEAKSRGWLLGGWAAGRWLKDTGIAPLIKAEESYRLYTLTGEIGTATGSKAVPLSEEDEPCHDTLAVAMTPVPSYQTHAVAVSASLAALPRQPRLQTANLQVYEDAARAVLQSKGLKNPQVKLTQVIRIDLDGDGVEEVVVSASHYSRGLLPEAAAGDYAMVFIRRLVEGKVITTLVEGEFFPKAQRAAPGELQVGAILDLNGDGRMEIVLFGRYYEGAWAAGYRVEGTKTVKLFSSGCGV